MCSDVTEKLLQRILDAVDNNDNIDSTYSISASQPLIIDYKERKYLFVRSSTNFTLSLEDIGSLPVPANTWVNLSYQQGIRLVPSVAATVLVRATDNYIHPDRVPSAVGSAIAAYSGNATQTATGAADTPFKFGTNGNTVVSHCVIQNNTGSNITYAFDQSATVSTNMVYILATGQTIFWDRSFTALHFSSAAQQNFGGASGISVEAFL